MIPPTFPSEREPLLQNGPRQNGSTPKQKEVKVEFSQNDKENPRNWPTWKKYIQVLLIFLIAFNLPMASGIFNPAIDEIAQSLRSSTQQVLLGQAVFVVMLGIAPLFLAPMSETFGRRPLFLVCLAVFALLQIPTALVGNLGWWIALRTLGGLFGSVGVANGGGSISDMFETRERAVVLGFYLVGPLLGPSIGPLIGALIVSRHEWRWIFGVLGILAGGLTVVCWLFLCETHAGTILEGRRRRLERGDPGTKFTVAGAESGKSLLLKVGGNSTRAVKILVTQPIVLTMSLYQALVFSTMYTLYSQYSKIWTEPPYNFNKTQLGLAYLGPALGFIITAFFIILFIDRLYEWLQCRYDSDDDGQPEYRLPMANIGAVFLPVSLFWFGWTVEKHCAWPIPLAATLFFGASQVSIFNCVQTYYIDAFEKHAASALAAGAFLRSVIGGIVPMFVSGMFEKLGFGLGMSVFGIIAVVLMPAPAVFYCIGRGLRKRFRFKG